MPRRRGGEGRKPKSSERGNARTRDSKKETPRGRIVMSRRFLIHARCRGRIETGAADDSPAYACLWIVVPHTRALGGGRFRRRARARALALLARVPLGTARCPPRAPAWRRAGPAGSAANASISAENADSFAADEVEAAGIMFDAFRATKGPDGERIDTARWSAETEARVEVRANARGPHPRTHATGSPARAGLPIVQAPIRRAHPPPHALASPIPLRPGSLNPDPPLLPLAGNRRRRPPRRLRERSDAGRASLLLVAKRDLYLLASAADLLKSATRRLRRGPRGDRGHLPRHMRRLARALRDPPRRARGRGGKLAEADAEGRWRDAPRSRIASRTPSAKPSPRGTTPSARGSRREATRTTRVPPGDASPNRSNKTPRSPLARHRLARRQEERSSAAAAGKRRRDRNRPTWTAGRVRAALEASLLKARAASSATPPSARRSRRRTKRRRRRGQQPPPRWAIDTAPVAAAAAAARAEASGAGPFGPTEA